MTAVLSKYSSELLGPGEIQPDVMTDAYRVPQGERTGSHGEDHDIGQFGYNPELEVWYPGVQFSPDTGGSC